MNGWVMVTMLIEQASKQANHWSSVNGWESCLSTMCLVPMSQRVHDTFTPLLLLLHHLHLHRLLPHQWRWDNEDEENTNDHIEPHHPSYNHILFISRLVFSRCRHRRLLNELQSILTKTNRHYITSIYLSILTANRIYIKIYLLDCRTH